MDPYIMARKRQAYVCVIGKIWMPSVKAATTYQLSDHDLANIESFTRPEMEDWLSTHAGDFASIIDFRAVCGAEEIDWANSESECDFNYMMCGDEP